METDDAVDVTILTALRKEADAFLRHLPSHEKANAKDQTWYKATLSTEQGSTYNIRLVSMAAMGNISAAIATHQAIGVWNPSQIILGGIAGGVKRGSDRQLGDVVIGEQVVYYEYGKQTPAGTTRRYQVYRPAHGLVHAARDLDTSKWALSIEIPRPDGTTGRVVPQVHFGVVASGEKVVTDIDLLNEIQGDWSQLVGIEMEGAGSATAAYQSGTSPGVLLAKGISDWADAEKADDWQEYAAESSASFVIALLKTAPFETKVRPQPIRLDVTPFSGKAKISICSRLVYDWHDLADYYEIPLHQRARFLPGREPQGVWEWLEQREKLYSLAEALKAISREDLLKQLS